VQGGSEETLWQGFEREGSLMSAAKRFTTLLCLAVLGAVSALLLASGSASAAMSIESFQYETTDAGGAPTQQASGHPDQVATTFNFPETAEHLPVEAPRNIEVDLPLGAVGVPTATPTCEEEQLNFGQCAPESQVGYISLKVFFVGSFRNFYFPLYNMKAQPGMLAQFGFHAFTTSVHLVARVRSEPDYGVTITVRNTPQPLPFTAVKTVFWGIPGDESHDEFRPGFDPVSELPCLTAFGPGGGLCHSHPEQMLSFLTNPSSCTPTSVAFGRVDSWVDQGAFASASAGNLNGSGEPVGISGCDVVPFSPTLEARPTTNLADSPSGLDVKLHLPEQDPLGVAEAQLKDAKLDFPPGMTVNPASAAGLDGCSPAQVGLLTPVGQPVAHFNEQKPSCPDASRLGTVEIETPLLPTPLHGSMYLASPHQNPFGSLLGLYMVVEDPVTGVLIKIPGEVKPDPQTGQLTVSFPHNPQLPFSDLNVDLFAGSRAPLKTPPTCGKFTTASEMVPWTAPEGKAKNPSDTFGIVSGAGNAPCPAGESSAPNQPSFKAGTLDPAAGSYSPFVLRLSRGDGSQPIKGLDATLPKGLLGRLAGIPYCPDAALAAAAGKSGAAEQASASCPAASQVGTVDVAAGAGSTPLNVSGKAYLAGPYKGAPLSLAIVTPAVAGPFDLGTVVVRNALQIDPETTQIHVVSDPIPTILQGIPLDIRSIAVKVNRPNFTLNPTDCEPSQVAGSALSVFDQSASLSSPFQVGGCNALGFKPRLALHLKGATKRTGHPALTAILRPRAGDANIAAAVVSLPHSEFLAQNHIKTICTRVQFAAGNCPKGSVYGKATAWSPLLDKPISGPVYLRSSDHPLPDLVADLNGQIRVTLVGRISSVKGGIANSFEMVPDAPVSKFVLRMQGGKKGLLENSRNLCRSTNKADVQFNGQNGKIRDFKPVVTNSCGKKKAKHHGKGKHKSHGGH
jgi:hypothetical protein